MNADIDAGSKRPRSRRLVGAALAVAAIAAASGAVALVLASRDGSRAPLTLNAGRYDPPLTAPTTTGRTSTGATVTVPRAGRPAVVTFLFADCPDICPLVASELAAALDRLGTRAADLDVVAISVDPAGDTPAAVNAFLRTHRLVGRLHYLIGGEAELAPHWDAWKVVAQPTSEARSLHSARIVLVDRGGRQVGAYPGGLAVPIGDLVADLETLLASTG